MSKCRLCGHEVVKGSLCDVCKMKTVNAMKENFMKDKENKISLTELKRNNTLYSVHLKNKT